MTEIQAKVKQLETSVVPAGQRVQTSDGKAPIAQNFSDSNTFERDTQEIILPESLNQTNLEVGQLKEDVQTLKAQFASFTSQKPSFASISRQDEEDANTEFEQYKMQLTQLQEQVRTIKSALDKQMAAKISATTRS